MAFVLASSRAVSAALGPVPPPLIGAALSSTAQRHFRTGIISMGHGSHTSDNNPEILEKEKQRNLLGKTPEIIPGQPGFNPALASDSEAVVRAERAPSLSIEQLQQHSIKIVQHLHDDAEHPTPDEVHDPSKDSPAIKDNMRYSQDKKDVHDPL